VVALCVSAILNILLKDIFHRARPDSSGWLIHEVDYSFPSGHSQNSAAFFITIAVLLLTNVKQKKIKIPLVTLCIILPLIVGFTRVYLGVHFTGDVLAGWALGAAVAFATVAIWAIFGELLKKHEKAHRFLFEETPSIPLRDEGVPR